jgi:hypothetical protein
LNLKTKIYWPLAVSFLVAVIGLLVFWKESQIAYHNHRLAAATKCFAFATGQRLPTRFEQFKLLLFGIDSTEASEAITRHQQALISLGFLQTREFTLTHRSIKDRTNWQDFHRQATNTFPDRFGYWSFSSPQSNEIKVTTEARYFPKWERLIAEFDH